MARLLKSVVLVLLLAIVPLRGIAALTGGLCAAGHAEAMQAHAGHADHAHSGSPSDDPGTQPTGEHDCNMCAEHCASASVLVAAEPFPLGFSAGTERIVLGERFAAGFIPEHLDPPPLAL